MPTSMATVAVIRAQFPALLRREGGEAVAYFDGPGGTQVPEPVAAAMGEYLFHHNANTHWAYPTSAETDAAIASARQALAGFLNAAPEEVAFGANMTTLTFHLARALGRQLGKGDEIVVTELDHQANVAPWQALERERGITLRTVRMNPATGQLDLGSLAGLIGENTRVVAIGAASNALGTINDVALAARLAHAAGALVFVDAVHYAPHQLVDVRAWDCDFLACSAYKFYGPHIGVLFGRKSLIEALDVPKLRPAPETAPERLETGTQNHEGIVGAGAAVDFLASLAPGSSRRARLENAYQVLHERGTAQLRMLWEGLSAIAGVRCYGPPPSAPHTPTIAFTMSGQRPVEVCRQLAAKGLFLSHGDFYATTAVERLGHAEGGLVRVGCACYTSDAEVERLLEAVRALVR